MKFLVVVSALLAVAMSAPTEPHVIVNQGTNGNYNLLIDAGDHKQVEESKDGHVVGTFSFVDDEGTLRTVQYTAGEEGFVATGDHLPIPEKETHEVAKAREEHLAAHTEVLKYLPITEEFNQGSLNSENIMLKGNKRLIPVIRYVEKEIDA